MNGGYGIAYNRTVKGNGEGEGKGNHQGWTFEDCPKPPAQHTAPAGSGKSGRETKIENLYIRDI